MEGGGGRVGGQFLEKRKWGRGQILIRDRGYFIVKYLFESIEVRVILFTY